MFESLKSGWRLAKQVRKSISGNKKLYLYPVITGLISAFIFIATLILLIFEVPVTGFADYYYLAGIFLAYILVYFVATLLIIAMMISYRGYRSGNNVSIGTALGMAREYSGKAFEWAILYSIILMILRMIESRIRGIGGIIIASIGAFAITVATFFVVPTILDYKLGPIKAIEKSVETIKSHFGNAFGGVIYIDLYTLIFTGSGFILLLLSAFLAGAIPFVILTFILTAGAVLIILGMILNFTYSNIFKLILFDYINGKGLPDGIDKNLINSAIRYKGGNRNNQF
ncbi:DUF6159 family protein [Ferroplasma sp.]|uniref:DUF6159 family protein n=1 Tax=Ferroplasma sp. TaxID=2591003 RepID=UPI00307D5D3B